jgi:hypothetical protein
MLLETELRRELSGVRAPAELWDRVELGSLSVAVAMPARQPRKAAWVLAAAAAIVLAVFFIPPRHEFKSQEFKSQDAARIREWVKANTGLDVPLRATAALRFVSAKASHGQAEIACRVGDRDVKLTVSKASGGAVAASAHQAYGSGSTVTWAMRGQQYTLASATPEDLQVACLLCHAGGMRPVG